jgi:hypothetical protein
LRLVALGMPVPDEVVLTRVAFDRFLDANTLRDRIDELSHVLDVRHGGSSGSGLLDCLTHQARGIQTRSAGSSMEYRTA